MVAAGAGAEPTADNVVHYGALYILAITAAASLATEGIMWLWAYRSASFRSLKVRHAGKFPPGLLLCGYEQSRVFLACKEFSQAGLDSAGERVRERLL